MKKDKAVYDHASIETKWPSSAKATEGQALYDHTAIETKWQEKWVENKTYSPDLDKASRPFYNLMMFPYPSAEGLHVGNMYAFTGADIYARFNRMQQKDVFEPIGLDGFGIHSENYALKIGKHPMDQAKVSEVNFYRQLKAIGNSFDWTRTLTTYDPGYYRWTQWIFTQMFKAGLAVRKKAPVNFCPSCKTVLSDEQVIPASPNASQGGDGACERCGTTVEKRDLEQWFFKITDYAERLLNNISGLDWDEKVKVAQKNWIGKSEGAIVKFSILNFKFSIDVFTTRPDTLYGATFLVLSPEHPVVNQFLEEKSIPEFEAVKKYVDEAKKKTERERLAEGKEKTGVFCGKYAVNPVNDEEIPVFIADYVLMGYGTGAIMAVPAHDARDFEFAKKFNLPIKQIIVPTGSTFAKASADKPDATQGKYYVSSIKYQESEKIHNAKYKIQDTSLEEAYVGSGVLINSSGWDGIEVPSGLAQILDDLEKRRIGKRETTYHLRDWLISRQRYWGPPIPMIYCLVCAEKGLSWFDTKEAKEKQVSSSKYQVSSREIHNTKYKIQDTNAVGWPAGLASESVAGWYPVEIESLPVELPYIEDYKPLGTGKSPLGSHPEFYETICPACGGPATRETDVSDTFLDSSWYFFRYLATDETNSAFNLERNKKWLPVNIYIGGAEHSVLHLLYARFIWKVFCDLGYVDFSAKGGPTSGWEEPFSRFFAHGLIIKNGAKMSKSKGNVIVPDEYIDKYGADTLRLYLMFLGPFKDGGDFSDSGIEGAYRFVKRIWNLFMNNIEITDTEEEEEVTRLLHKTIKEVTHDIEEFSYNTAIARMMEFYNFLSDKKLSPNFVSDKKTLSRSTVIGFTKLISPFAPHLAEEIYQCLMPQSGNNTFKSIHLEEWPKYDEKLTAKLRLVVVIQVNGKRRGELELSTAEANDQKLVEKKAREIITKYLDGQTITKVVFIPGRIVNFVV